MTIQAILWLDPAMIALGYIKDVMQDMAKTNNLDLFFFGNLGDYIQKVIELDKSGVSYLVITESDFVGLDSNQITIPKEVYLEHPSEQPRIFKTGFFGLYLCQSMYDFIVIDGIKYKSRLKRPPIIIFTSRDGKDIEKFQRDILGEGFLRAIINKFLWNENEIKKIIESL